MGQRLRRLPAVPVSSASIPMDAGFLLDPNTQDDRAWNEYQEFFFLRNKGWRRNINHITLWCRLVYKIWDKHLIPTTWSMHSNVAGSIRWQAGLKTATIKTDNLLRVFCSGMTVINPLRKSWQPTDRHICQEYHEQPAEVAVDCNVLQRICN